MTIIGNSNPNHTARQRSQQEEKKKKTTDDKIPQSRLLEHQFRNIYCRWKRESMKEQREKGKKKGALQPFEFCKICNLNHCQGRGHIYFPSHTRALSAFLSRFRCKLSDVLFFLKNPAPLHPEHTSLNRLWCIFCDTLLQEIHSSFVCANTIKHLASKEHSNSVRDFLRKYGGGMDRLESFCISEANFIKWEACCRSLNGALSSSKGSFGAYSGPPKDIRNELSSVSHPDSNEVTNTGPASYASASHLVSTNKSAEPQKMQEAATTQKGEKNLSFLREVVIGQPALKVVQPATKIVGEVQWLVLPAMPVLQEKERESYKYAIILSANLGFQNFTQIPRLDTKGSAANVHTGGPPPWLETNEESDSLVRGKGSYLNSLTSHSHQSGKRQKLNPKRVGAAWAEKRKIELEREKRGEIVANQCGDDWLPNFGRVWQAGTRKESRKEFEMEKQRLLKADQMSDSSFNIQPYISKRMVSSGPLDPTSMEFGNTNLTGAVENPKDGAAIISNSD
ncbi:hypothetical protein ACLOJK_001773 [Asimina triloba]